MDQNSLQSFNAILEGPIVSNRDQRRYQEQNDEHIENRVTEAATAHQTIRDLRDQHQLMRSNQITLVSYQLYKQLCGLDDELDTVLRNHEQAVIRQSVRNEKNCQETYHLEQKFMLVKNQLDQIASDVNSLQ